VGLADKPLKGQAARGAATREAIVAAAIQVFSEHGYRSGALADIGAKVDVSPAGILYHFGSKEELLLAVIAERDRRAGEVIAADSGREGIDALRSTIRFAEQCERERGLAALHSVLQAESFEPDSVTHEYFLQRSRFLRALMAETLLEGQRRAEIRLDVDVNAKAAEVVAFLEGAATVWLMDPETSLVELYTNYFEDLIRAIAPEDRNVT
jgi:AcrR family transcriptional regulator